jgi:hypothetical protein
MRAMSAADQTIRAAAAMKTHIASICTFPSFETDRKIIRCAENWKIGRRSAMSSYTANCIVSLTDGNIAQIKQREKFSGYDKEAALFANLFTLMATISSWYTVRLTAAAAASDASQQCTHHNHRIL